MYRYWQWKYDSSITAEQHYTHIPKILLLKDRQVILSGIPVESIENNQSWELIEENI